MDEKNKRIAVLGASRGFGRSLSLKYMIESGSEDKFFLASRKIKSSMFSLENSLQGHLSKASWENVDFTQVKLYSEFILRLRDFNPTHIFYVAGGGPFGPFASKQFKDHLWAIRLSFLFPAQLIHMALLGEFSNLRQLICVGSAIAESQADPGAASYSAAKHGLKGLLSTLVEEPCPIDLRLFSPPYMKTDMVPEKSALERKLTLKDPGDVAQSFYEWAKTSSGPWHFMLN